MLEMAVTIPEFGLLPRIRQDLCFNPLAPADLLRIERQPSQRRVLGLDGAVSPEEAEGLAAERVAWTARLDGRIIACFGINETFPGVQGVGWAILAPHIGAAHLPLTRFIRSRVILATDLARLELFAIANDAEAILARWGPLDAAELLEAVMVRPTRECAWAALLGVKPAHVLRKFGQASETHVLFERIA
jgi:hypothetical protein